MSAALTRKKCFNAAAPCPVAVASAALQGKASSAGELQITSEKCRAGERQKVEDFPLTCGAGRGESMESKIKTDG